MKLVLRGKQNKTKHVVHVKVINLRWILSFLFFLPPSPKSCFLLRLPRAEDKVIPVLAPISSWKPSDGVSLPDAEKTKPSWWGERDKNKRSQG